MQFSVVLALLPLALASPIASPIANCTTDSQPCCVDCDTKLFTDCMNRCPDHPFFTVCKFTCTRDRVDCLKDCIACDGTRVVPPGDLVVKPGPKERSEEKEEEEKQKKKQKKKPAGLQPAKDVAIYNKYN
ncbi:hypothetical protein V8C37DRAFT_222853 [Trichoderma ceciliae]